MYYRMICESKDCSYDLKPYKLEIRSEAYMDERNIAAMFCPYCHRQLAKQEVKNTARQ